MKKLILIGAALLALVGVPAALAATQLFPFAGVTADAVAAFIMGPNGTAAASATNAIPTSSQAVGAEYETVAASQTAQVMGATGAAGDYLDHCTIIVATAATAATSILDNATTIVAFANSPGGGIGVYDIPIRARSVSGAWKITTGAGASVVCTGDFL